MLLLILVIGFARPGWWPAWVISLGHGLAILIGVAFGLNAYRMYADWRSGNLFIVRNLTFYSAIFTIVVLLYFVIGEISGRGEMSILGWWLIPMLLFYYSQQIFRVQINEVRLTLKLGLGEPQSIPLFTVKNVSVERDGIVLERSGGERSDIKRNLFSSGQWTRLVSRLLALRR